jgi:hypothetical protein
LRRNLLSESNLHQKIDSIAAVVSESQEWHYLTWGHLGAATGTPETQAPSLTYSEEVQRLKDWITRRLNWLDIHMPGTLNGCSMTALKENQAFDFEAYPNPFHSSVHLQLTSTYKGHGQIRLLDARGIAVKVEEINTTGSTQNFELNDLNELSSGIYFLEITLDSSKNIVKLIK